MQTFVRNNDIGTTFETFMHGCILHLLEDEVLTKTREFFLFSTNVTGAELHSKSVKEIFRGEKINLFVNVHQSESKHRVRVYTNTVCRAVARTHLIPFRVDWEVMV